MHCVHCIDVVFKCCTLLNEQLVPKKINKCDVESMKMAVRLVNVSNIGKLDSGIRITCSSLPLKSSTFASKTE